MKLDFRFLALLLTLAVGLGQAASAEESQRVVIWTITTSSKAPSLEKARETHKATLDRLKDSQTDLEIADEDFIPGTPELHRDMYRTIPKGYEFRQTVYLRQRDLSRFDEFFEALAPEDSEATRVRFAFTRATWRPPVESKPTDVEWHITLLGGGKTLVDSKARFDAHLIKMQQLLEEYDISAIRVGTPKMYTVPEQLREYDKPDGYTFQKTLTFRQNDMEQFDALLDKLSKIDSDYLHVWFTHEPQEPTLAKN